MVYNGEDRKALRRDQRQEFNHQFASKKLSSALDSVCFAKRKSSSCRNSTRADGILQLKICVVVVAALACGCRSQSSGTNFSFDENFVSSDFITLKDALLSTGQIKLNSNGGQGDGPTMGRALYRRPVQFLDPATNSVLASFQTSFSFTIFATNSSNKGQGFAFGFFPDITTVGDGQFMGILPLAYGSNGLPPGFNHTFVVEFDTNRDIEFRDVSDNHVGVNWNSMESLNATDLSILGLNLVSGNNFTASIAYSYGQRKLSVWLETSVPNISDPPVLEVTDLDLSQRLLPNMYVGFAGGAGVKTNEIHTITSWTFSSLHSDPEKTSKDCKDGECLKMKKNFFMMVIFSGVIVCLTLLIVAVLCFFRWRRRKAKAAMVLKLNPEIQGPPLQELKSYSPLSHKSETRHSSWPNAPNSTHTSSSSSNTLRSPGALVGSKFPLSPPRFSHNVFTPRRDSSIMRILSSMDPSGLRYKHSRNSPFGSKRFNTTQELEKVSSLGPRRYSYRELKVATNGFKEELGQGGSGIVYKGYLPDLNDACVPVAVKVVTGGSGQGEREFLTEVNIIAGLRHRHLVQIYGWCHNKGNLLLIYHFMENGSLDKHLYGRNSGNGVLSWNVRCKALRQVASALTYLHDEAEHKIIHRDVKSSNVLLDSKFNARLGDFGLARRSDHSQPVPDTTVMAGTMGYLAPELVQTGRATTKTDVFSFGALILEVICAKRPLDSKRPEEEVVLADWVWGLLAAGHLLDAIDPRLTGGYDETNAIRALHVGLMCVLPDHTCRPPIRYALQMLLGDLAVPTLPRFQPTSSAFHIPIRLLLDSSLGTIAAAMESHVAEAALTAAEFDAPWMLEHGLES